LDYSDRITSSPDLLDGEPVIRHLPLPVSLIRDLLDTGMSDDDILGMYPELEPDDLAAVRAWATQAET
jgi:uncharacterized protein (DUF433 family)